MFARLDLITGGQFVAVMTTLGLSPEILAAAENEQVDANQFKEIEVVLQRAAFCLHATEAKGRC